MRPFIKHLAKFRFIALPQQTPLSALADTFVQNGREKASSVASAPPSPSGEGRTRAAARAAGALFLVRTLKSKDIIDLSYIAGIRVRTFIKHLNKFRFIALPQQTPLSALADTFVQNGREKASSGTPKPRTLGSGNPSHPSLRATFSRLRARSGSALSAHRAEIHYRTAAALPAGEGWTRAAARAAGALFLVRALKSKGKNDLSFTPDQKVRLTIKHLCKLRFVGISFGFCGAAEP